MGGAVLLNCARGEKLYACVLVVVGRGALLEMKSAAMPTPTPIPRP